RVWGHRLTIRYLAISSATRFWMQDPPEASGLSDVVGTSDDGVAVDLSLDPEKSADSPCTDFTCSDRFYFDPDTGCGSIRLSEDKSVIDGIPATSTRVHYSKCPNA